MQSFQKLPWNSLKAHGGSSRLMVTSQRRMEIWRLFFISPAADYKFFQVFFRNFLKIARRLSARCLDALLKVLKISSSTGILLLTHLYLFFSKYFLYRENQFDQSTPLYASFTCFNHFFCPVQGVQLLKSLTVFFNHSIQVFHVTQ